jgi:hypothetical protein
VLDVVVAGQAADPELVALLADVRELVTLQGFRIR